MGRILVHITHAGTTWRGFLLPAGEQAPPVLFNIILNGDCRGNLCYDGKWTADALPELAAALGTMAERRYGPLSFAEHKNVLTWHPFNDST